MKWRRIDKSKSSRPSKGTYSDWKPELAREGDHRCVYCSIHENRLGGERMFHVEHLKPKSKFKHLTNDYDNLFYSCPICNTFKSNSWFDVDEGDFDSKHYPNPCNFDFSDFFEADKDNWRLSGHHTTGTFLVERLHLNRPHLCRERRYEALHDHLDAMHQFIFEFGLIDQLCNAGHIDLLAEIAKLQNEISMLSSMERGIPLYSKSELT